MQATSLFGETIKYSSILCGAALVLVAVCPTALVADGAPPQQSPQQKPQQKPPQSPPQSQQQKPPQKPQAKPQQKPQPKPQPKKQKSAFGASASYVVPAGVFGDAASGGFGVGVFWDMPLSGNLYGVASAQYNLFGGKDVLGVKSSAATPGATYDLNYYFGKGRSGLYGLAGVGYYNCTVKVESELFGPLGSNSMSKSKGELGFEAGAGFYFTPNCGVEAKYFAGGDSWTWVQASFKLRF